MSFFFATSEHKLCRNDHFNIQYMGALHFRCRSVSITIFLLSWVYKKVQKALLHNKALCKRHFREQWGAKNVKKCEKLLYGTTAASTKIRVLKMYKSSLLLSSIGGHGPFLLFSTSHWARIHGFPSESLDDSNSNPHGLMDTKTSSSKEMAAASYRSKKGVGRVLFRQMFSQIRLPT